MVIQEHCKSKSWTKFFFSITVLANLGWIMEQVLLIDFDKRCNESSTPVPLEFLVLASFPQKTLHSL